jgi:hypothetical protein
MPDVQEEGQESMAQCPPHNEMEFG